jgi:hypothetical protein
MIMKKPKIVVESTIHLSEDILELVKGRSLLNPRFSFSQSSHTLCILCSTSIDYNILLMKCADISIHLIHKLSALFPGDSWKCTIILQTVKTLSAYEIFLLKLNT